MLEYRGFVAVVTCRRQIAKESILIVLCNSPFKESRHLTIVNKPCYFN